MSILSNIQVELKAPKSQYNSFGKYKYRSLEDIQEALKPLLQKYGCYLVISDSIEMIGDRFYVVATATLYEENNKIVASNQAYARESQTKKGMDDSQITGATSSYARKYALNGLFCIDDTKDADTMDNGGHSNTSNNKKQTNKTPKQASKTPKELRQDIVHYTTENKIPTDVVVGNLKAHFAGKQLKELSSAQLEELLTILQAAPKS